MLLEDWLDDLCVRFIINLPPEELASVERICFQVEEAQWFYEDFVRPLDPTLPSLNLKQFSLRIFQHCPLFSQWSAQHHTTAFAEFLAYKQRVPVRGAIMLNEEMDEVLLVKGWKKGANWSFPRGKINKDEDDLDCAVREVYEETGFDIRAAGLVKPEREMKYIEVTMREQHMRLYVFRGVPKDTQFAPRTRKEISKIEWYKLTDLPTQKKKHHHDGHDEALAINANKFYMVAPFLHPLKKWIMQQKKRETRYSSNLAVPPVFAEESATENEYGAAHVLHHKDMALPSSLPEVSAHQAHSQDPSMHLKELLKIGTPVAFSRQNTQSNHVESDIQKSSALLALLRGGTNTNKFSQPQSSNAQEQSIELSPQPNLAAELGNPPVVDFRSSQPTLPEQQKDPHQRHQQTLLQLFSSKASPAPQEIPSRSVATPQEADSPQMGSYSNTSNPLFPQQVLQNVGNSAMPYAGDLPDSSDHSRTLLNALQTSTAPQMLPKGPAQPSNPQPQISANKQALLAAFKMTTSNPASQSFARANAESSRAETEVVPGVVELSTRTPTIVRHEQKVTPVQATQSVDLLELFKRPNDAPASYASNQSTVPVELSAGPVESTKPQVQPSQNEILTALFKKDRPEQVKRQRSPVTRAGQTGATIDVPLNQPQFDGIIKSPPADSDLRRSPLPSHRTLYNPKQPTPVKILTRHDNKQQQPTRSPRPQKANMSSSSPKRHSQPKEKPFQPQILRRPQGVEPPVVSSPSPSLPTITYKSRESLQQPVVVSTSPSPSTEQGPMLSPAQTTDLRRPSHQSDVHKQTLLSLFGGGSPGAFSPSFKQPDPISTSPGLTSPVSHSRVVSPIGDEPISTQSRVGSLASITGGGIGIGITGAQYGGLDGRPKVEKKQTAAGDKAFLLGYLGRIASQDT